MIDKSKPKSLEGRWHLLYCDYPKVHEKFGRIPKVPDFINVMAVRFPLQGKAVSTSARGPASRP